MKWTYLVMGGPEIVSHLCQRCGYCWSGTLLESGSVCPACKNPDWNKIDKERLFRGRRKSEIPVAFGIILFFWLPSVVVVTATIYSIVLGDYLSSAKDFSLAGFAALSTAGTSLTLWLLVSYYRHLYFDPVFEISSIGSYHPPSPSKCRICGRHPVSRNYYTSKIHRLSKGTRPQYYENCGCKYCVKPIERIGFG